jgi:predicted membrane protein
MGLILTPLLFIVMVGFVVLAILLSLRSGETALTVLMIAATTGMGIAIAAITIGMSALLYAYLSGVVAMVYLDRRMRREGYDLVLLRRAEVDEAAARKSADALPHSTAGEAPA